jgi:hypothetical protein
MEIEVNTEELDALIEFQKTMQLGALDSCEYLEANQRQNRITELMALRRKAARQSRIAV